MCLTVSVGQGAPNARDDVRLVQILLNMNQSRAALPEVLAEDGAFGPKTRSAIAMLQSNLLGAAEPTGQIAPDDETLLCLAEGIPDDLPQQLRAIMLHSRSDDIARYAGPLNAAMARYGIDNRLRQAHFLAQLGHESGSLRHSEELASGEAYEGRTDLGNTQPGDGRRFKGRGLIQLTGRANYTAYGAARGDDFTSGDNPSRLAEDPEIAADVAGWFWHDKALDVLADADDLQAVTRRINGGLNGLADRAAYLRRAKFFFGLVTVTA